MALKKPTATDVSDNTAPAWEDEIETTSAVVQDDKTIAPAVTAAPAPAAAPAAAAAAAQATAVVAQSAASSAVTVNAAARAKEFKREMEEMRGSFDFSYGNFRICKGSNGEIAEMGNGKTATMGRWAEVRMMGWDDSYQVSPGEDGARTKDFVAFSKDGQVVDSVIGEELRHFVGKTVSEYVSYLKDTEGFSKAGSSRYINIACLVLEAEKPGFAGDSVQITLSQSSIPAFQSYQQELKMKAKAAEMGLNAGALPEDPFRFYFSAVAASKGTTRWTKLAISSKKPT